ncbi:glycosyltransferase family 2 protein [Pseudoalteromonas sp. Z1A8]|uniref:glycosyltransferase family 2 protein n=1 Tax=Pseudoalteromonas sp. Z1A8 TaxID=2686354 RepID=UPI001409743A|nr:glycosyltransferase family 2 protein [Pseudoalteromonas sp. Z1A8]
MIKISVLMPVYNESKFVKAAVNSLLSQSGNLFIEIIIVDDFSTDDTFDLISKFSLNYDCVKVFRNTSKGKNNAFNLAYEKSTGDYFILFAGDDLLPQNSVSLRLEPIINHKGPAVSLCKLKMFSEEKKYDGIVLPKDPNKGNVSGGTMLFNIEFSRLVFPLPNHLANEDMWILCGLKYFDGITCFHIPMIGINYRIHENNSVSFMDNFDKKNINMHKRNIVYSCFLEKYRLILNDEKIRELSNLAAIESLRYQGNFLSIVFMKNLSFTDKARCLVHSSKFLYFVRTVFFKLFSGRG